MKAIKKLSALLLVGVLMLTLSVSAFAAEPPAVTEGPVSEVIIGGDDDLYRASNAPTEFKNLGGSNYYTATLIDLAAGRGSYSKYYFATGTNSIYLKCDLERSGTTTHKTRKLTIKLYEKEKASSTGVYKTSETITFTAATSTQRVKFTRLDPNKFYYVRFCNDSSTDPATSYDISGSILVDDVYN